MIREIIIKAVAFKICYFLLLCCKRSFGKRLGIFNNRSFNQN